MAVLGKKEAENYWNSLSEPELRALDPGTLPADRYFERWWRRASREHRTWVAEFVTADEVRKLDLRSDMSWSWGVPLQETARLLDHFTAEGWRIIHVSEDHGLYSGADAADEAYLTRVRYLLSKPVGSLATFAAAPVGSRNELLGGTLLIVSLTAMAASAWQFLRSLRCPRTLKVSMAAPFAVRTSAL